MVILDIDHFKKVNDAHGHHIGDEVLCWLARLVMGQARETDFVARDRGGRICGHHALDQRGGRFSVHREAC